MFFREDLNAARCDCPDCQNDITNTDFYLHPVCHFGSNVQCYYRADGALVIICAECGKTVTEVAVASRENFK